MSENDRHFDRRRITWKLTGLTRDVMEFRKTSPKFCLSLGDNRTAWQVLVIRNSEHLGVFLLKLNVDRTDFSVTFNAAIKRTTQGPSYTNAAGFNVSCEEKFKELGLGLGWPKFISIDVLFDEKNQLLRGNELVLDIQLGLMENPKIVMPMEDSRLLDNYEKLINNQKYSDFVFICSDGGEVFVQKSNIAAHCEAFAAMLEDGFSEAQSGSANITDIDSETMLELVRFLYCGRVKELARIQKRLVIAANKYGIDQLKDLCVSSMMESLNDQNVLVVYKIAELLGEKHLKDNCIDYIKCHQFRLQDGLKKENFSKELLWDLWNSTDSHQIRLCFIDGNFIRSLSMI